MDVKAKLAEKIRKNAIDWYANKSPKTDAIRPATEKKEIEPEKIENEIELVEQIEEIISNAEIPSERKVISAASLKSSREELMSGGVPERLPNVIRNLAQKEVIGQKIKNVCDKMTNGGKSYSYLWGL